MLTIEYRTDGQLIGFTNIVNKGYLPGSNAVTLCEFTHKPIELRGVTSGAVKHKISDGFEVLALKVLEKITKK